jgi:plasmid stabilization system protein ParE
VKVRFTPSARLQFFEAISYISRDNPTAARRFRVKSEKLLRRLEDFPASGRIIPEFPDLPHREVIIKPYRFFYRVEKSTVWIVAVWHSAQETSQPGE